MGCCPDRPTVRYSLPFETEPRTRNREEDPMSIQRLACLLASVFALLTALPCEGADMADFRFYGFSRDGSHLAWEQYGIQDGSGFPWASFTIQSALTGERIASDTLVLNLYSQGWPEAWQEQGLDALGMLRDSLLSTMGADLDRLEIPEGAAGVALLERLETDLSEYSTAEFVREWLGPGYSRGPRYRLTLQCDSVATEMMYMAPLVSLRILLEGAGRELVLADDGEAGAPVAYWYHVRGVRMYADSVLAVVLSKGEPGFEGPNTRWRVVAGVLPEGLRP